MSQPHSPSGLTAAQTDTSCYTLTALGKQHPRGCPAPAPSGGWPCKPPAPRARDRDWQHGGALTFCFLEHIRHPQSSNQNPVYTLLFTPVLQGGRGEGSRVPSAHLESLPATEAQEISTQSHLFLSLCLNLSQLRFGLFNTGRDNRTREMN